VGNVSPSEHAIGVEILRQSFARTIGDKGNACRAFLNVWNGATPLG